MNLPPAEPQTILVIEDEVQIRRLLRLTLESAGYRMREAEDGLRGLSEIAAQRPDAVILDLGLPDMSGVEVVRQLRAWSHLPVLVVTLRSAESDKIAALDAGADDYLTKPFGSGELVARVRALLRRTRPDEDDSPVKFGEIEVDRAAGIVRRGGAEVKLTAKEFELLKLLVEHRGKVVTHRQILVEVWGPKAAAQTHYLRVYMTHLRQKIEADPHHPRHLKTEPGIGFRLVED